MNFFKRKKEYQYYNKSVKSGAGFTLVELIVGVTVFTVLIVAVYGSYQTVYNVVATSRSKISAVDLANEEMELIRNLPYASVGISGGIPNGVLTHSQTIVRDGATFVVLITVRNIDDPFDGTLGGTPNDLSPADSKLVEVEIDCALCKNFKPVITDDRVAPKNLETASTNGALFVKAFDANGNPVKDAAVHIVNAKVTPTITIDDVTDNGGLLEVVDAPPGQKAYQITVTKSGYTTDMTYATSSSNLNPTKPNATVLLQQVTAISFIIDKLSSAIISSTDETCNAVSGVTFNLTGSKTIGSNPVIYKYNQNLSTNGSGLLSLSNMEWDSYTFTLTDSTRELIGTNPLSLLTISPNSSQNVSLVVQTKSPDTVLATIKDSTTGLPISDATVELLSSGGAVLATRITGKGFVNQTDWSGGSGQATTSDSTKYLSSDGNITVNSPVGDAKLRSSLGQYQSDGSLISSSFDTGEASNFGNIIWSPQDQATSTGGSAVSFQIATNNDGGTWNFTGPDGTGGTYYSLANTNITSVNNGNRYIRYKMFLHTDDTNVTPNISDVAITFTTFCAPPGQVFFSGLSSGNYSIQVSKTGYETQTVPLTINSAWQATQVILLPQ